MSTIRSASHVPSLRVVRPAATAASKPVVATSATKAAASAIPTTTLGDARAFTAADGVKVAFRVTEAKTANPEAVVVHVPGLGSNSHYMDELGKQLGDENLLVYAIDNRGHGLTEGPQADVASYRQWVADVDRLVAIAKQENPGKPVVVSGSSMGALIALRYAQSHPKAIDGVIAMSPVFLNKFFGPKHYAQLVWAMVSRLWDKKALDRHMDTPMNLNVPLTTNPEAEKMGREDPYLRKTVTARLYLNVLKMSIRNWLGAPAQNLPTLVATAGDDKVNVNAAVKAFQKLQGGFNAEEKKFVNYPGAGHDLPEEWHRPEIARDLAAFVKQQAK